MSTRVAVVTGASRGIGRACAERLASEGMHVIATARRASAVEETVAAITAAGGSAVAVAGDVADENAMRAVFDHAPDGVDVVVHAAASMALSSIVDLDFAAFDELVRTNLRGTFVIAQFAAKRAREGGAIVLFSSSIVVTRPPGYGAYAATKAGIEALTLVLARELRGRSVTVNTVAPGPTATGMLLDSLDEHDLRERAQASPLERLGTPDDIAETVAFLCRGDQWINGQVVRVNGGFA